MTVSGEESSFGETPKDSTQYHSILMPLEVLLTCTAFIWLLPISTPMLTVFANFLPFL
jgi:hypothetical protein